MAKMTKTAERALPRAAANTLRVYNRGLVVTGVVASKLIANLEGKKAAAPGPARKKRKTKAK